MAEDPSIGGGETNKGKWRYGRMRDKGNAGNMWRSFSQFIVMLLVLAAVAALILWLVYRPHKPKFTLVGAAVFDLNTSSSLFISTSMQFTVVIRNPNNRVSIYYDRLSAVVSYKNQIITTALMLPPLHQDKDSTVSMSPMIGGVAVPVSVEVTNGLLMEIEGFGLVQLRLVLQGRVRWEAGGIKTAHKDLYVTCDMLLGLKKGIFGQVPLLGPNHDPDQDYHACKVDV